MTKRYAVAQAYELADEQYGKDRTGWELSQQRIRKFDGGYHDNAPRRQMV